MRPKRGKPVQISGGADLRRCDIAGIAAGQIVIAAVQRLIRGGKRGRWADNKAITRFCQPQTAAAGYPLSPRQQALAGSS